MTRPRRTNTTRHIGTGSRFRVSSSTSDGRFLGRRTDASRQKIHDYSRIRDAIARHAGGRFRSRHFSTRRTRDVFSSNRACFPSARGIERRARTCRRRPPARSAARAERARGPRPRPLASMARPRSGTPPRGAGSSDRPRAPRAVGGKRLLRSRRDGAGRERGCARRVRPHAHAPRADGIERATSSAHPRARRSSPASRGVRPSPPALDPRVPNEKHARRRFITTQSPGGGFPPRTAHPREPTRARARRSSRPIPRAHARVVERPQRPAPRAHPRRARRRRTRGPGARGRVPIDRPETASGGDLEESPLLGNLGFIEDSTSRRCFFSRPPPSRFGPSPASPNQPVLELRRLTPPPPPSPPPSERSQG